MEISISQTRSGGSAMLSLGSKFLENLTSQYSKHHCSTKEIKDDLHNLFLFVFPLHFHKKSNYQPFLHSKQKKSETD